MAPTKELKEFSVQDVASHNTEESLWIIIDGVVYDLTRFADLHPGGLTVLLDVAGKDATQEFYGLHRQAVLTRLGPKYEIGRIAGHKQKIAMAKPGDISKVPYAEPVAWQGFYSPYYTESHFKFRAALRKFFDEEILPDAPMKEEAGEAADDETFAKLGAAGILACRMGPGPHLKGFNLPGGVKPEEFDYFHEQIAHEEAGGVGLPGYQDSLGTGMVIGLPPVMHFARKEVKEKVVREVLTGKKRICLAITEATAGSDVAAIATTARKSPCGKFYIVNGTKKWITNGKQSDYFSTAVRTGDGPGGISMLLIERSEGVETKQIKTSYSAAAGTAYITFENVKVPVENLLGKEGGGFQVIMFNFNHERWFIVAGVTRGMRMVVEECFKWTQQRMVFGKPLIEQPVIRAKLAKMISEVESVHHWLENMTYQMTKMDYKEASVKLGGPIALLKLRCTRVATDISDEGCQIFGGRAITKTGMGRLMEGFQRTFKFASILGGSEEIMADLGVRQAMRFYPTDAKL
ncbi:acyl-CoA dehydrogenase/oxidase [Fimicolochytrium jonesii]|uniref:acyl-CoA dehydrogenase/oxidase n=1 Tax=Fimicolochytrium jonesii TaxID=1396493 RepID=UPI0022FE0B5D|nr:acyl-CoA dehydrogenase/oxidase [Fimicolochytrium jonesii]KAI8819314.1 acyl-CoA dehydrogenase/oxidase [Fimicolochytrium jonesii]